MECCFAEKATPLDIIRLEMAEFANVDDCIINRYIDLFRPLVSKKKFGKLYNQALALFVAHKMRMFGLGDNTQGSIADMVRANSYSEGEISIGYAGTGVATSGGPDAEFALTPYGIQFLQLRRYVIIPITIDTPYL